MGDDAGIGFVYVAVFAAFVAAGAALVIVGEMMRPRGAGHRAWLMTGTGIAILLVPAAVLISPALTA